MNKREFTEESLLFIYKGFLQSIEIDINGSYLENGKYHVVCHARLKLPILKKNYATWTLYRSEDLDWEKHSPIREDGNEDGVVYAQQFPVQTLDPIGLFLKIHRKVWQKEKVNIVVGGKEVSLDVSVGTKQVVVSRSEKNQKLVIKLGPMGIEAIEVPIPVLGALQIKRVM